MEKWVSVFCSFFFWAQLGRPLSSTHSRADPVASSSERLVFRLLFLLGKHKGGWGVRGGVFGCLLISSESRAGRQGNAHFHVLCEAISPREHSNPSSPARWVRTQAKLPPFTLAYLFLVVCILPLSWRWHTRVHANTHACTRTCSFFYSRVIHASFQITVLIKCSHTLECRLNKLKCESCFFRRDPRKQIPFLSFFAP